MGLYDLAPELLQNVIKYLRKKYLKHLRSTCRRFAVAAVIDSSLFDSIFHSVDPRHLAIATSILQRFKPILRTIVISPLEYQHLRRVDYHTQWGRVRNTVSFPYSAPDRTRREKHLDLAHKWHRALFNRQEKVGCQDALRQVLQSAPHVRNIILTHRNRDITNLELNQICHWKTCPLEKEMHNTFRLSPWHNRTNDPWHRNRSFEDSDLHDSMMVLLNSSDLKAQELIMEAYTNTRPAWYIHPNTVNRLASYVSTTATFLVHLRKLRLSIGGWFLDEGTTTVATFISQAQSLECLYLHSGDTSRHTNRVDRFLSEGRFPNLRTLILEGGSTTDDDLLSMLYNVPELKHLVLEDIQMKRPHWRIVIDGIKSSLNLTSLHMNLLFGDKLWTGRSYYSDVHIESEDGVDKFLRSEGTHPFAVTATEFCTRGEYKHTHQRVALLR